MPRNHGTEVLNGKAKVEMTLIFLNSTYEASDNVVVLQMESKQKEVLILHNTQLSHGISCYRMFRMPKYI